MGDTSAEERIAELEAKVAVLLAEKVAWQGEAKELREQLAQALVQIGQLLARVHELEGRVAKDSHSCSKPLSSDGLAHKTRSQRDASGKKSGGQPGHERHHLKLVETPDEVMRHRPRRCSQCPGCIRSYLSTMRKQGQAMLHSISAVFAGRPLPIAWATG